MDDVKSLVVSRPEEGVVAATAVTPGADSPNIQVKTLPGWAIVLIRAVRAWWFAFTGLVTLKMTGFDDALGIPLPSDLLPALLLCAKAATSTWIVAGIQNSLELWRRIDQKFPEVRG
jgi:hypothetical protein